MVEHSGFSAAGRHLGIPKSRLSRRISQLEERLGVRLLQRSSRRLTLTSVGQLFYERCQSRRDSGRIGSRDGPAGGIHAPGSVARQLPDDPGAVLAHAVLAQFMREFSRVRVMLTVTNREVDPVDEYIDVVLRVRRPPFVDSSLVVRRLLGVRDVLVVSLPSRPQ